jgi:hypothetical protein
VVGQTVKINTLPDSHQYMTFHVSKLYEMRISMAKNTKHSMFPGHGVELTGAPFMVQARKDAKAADDAAKVARLKELAKSCIDQAKTGLRLASTSIVQPMLSQSL